MWSTNNSTSNSTGRPMSSDERERNLLIDFLLNKEKRDLLIADAAAKTLMTRLDSLEGRSESAERIQMGQLLCSTDGHRSAANLDSSLLLSDPCWSTVESGLREGKVALPSVLFALLSSPEFEHILTWMPHGRAWKICSMQLFVNEILPCYFNFGAFPRNVELFLLGLKRWGFRQFSKGPDQSAYFHELFVRGLELYRLMKPTSPLDRTHFDSQVEPNFYRLPPLPNVALATSSESSLVASKKPQAVDMATQISQANQLACLAAQPTSPPTYQSPVVSSRPLLYDSLSPSSLARLRYLELNPAAATVSQPLSPQDLYEKNLHYLRCAQHVAAEIPLLPPLQQVTSSIQDPSVVPLVAASKATANPASQPATVNGKQVASTCGESHDSKVGSPKKARRKWLPPLGPPTASDDPKAPNYDWIYTNPELFASLTESKK